MAQVCSCGVLQAQRWATSAWQLMFLHGDGDGQAYSLPVPEAVNLGYRLTASAHRVVLRAQYKQPQAEVTMVGEHMRRRSHICDCSNHSL